MPRSLTSTFVQTIQDLQAGSALFYLVTLTSSEWGAPIRLVNNQTDIVSRGDTFTAMAFDVSLAVDDGKTLPAMQFTMDNVDRSLIREIRTLLEPPTLLLEFILSNDVDTVEIAFPDMKVNTVSYDVNTIRLGVTVSDILNRVWPAEKILPQNYPGLFGN